MFKEYIYCIWVLSENLKILLCQASELVFGKCQESHLPSPLQRFASSSPLILGLPVSFPCPECLYDRIAQETVDETEIAQRLSKVNKYICEKIMDINKSCKNEERREAKYNLQ